MNIFITGANRGIGLCTAQLLARQGHHVFACHRSSTPPPSLTHPNITPIRFDVTQPIDAALESILGQCDVLINNAGWGADIDEDLEATMESMPIERLDKALDINAIAPLRLIQAILPHLKARNFGRIVNVSSARASMGLVIGDSLTPAYRLSKVLLNAITAFTAMDMRQQGYGETILINALCPGWCQTDMGGPLAYEPPEKGAERISTLVNLPNGGPNGQYFINDHIHSF